MFYIQYQSLLNGRWIRSRYADESGNSSTDVNAVKARVDYLNSLGDQIKFRVADARGKEVTA